MFRDVCRPQARARPVFGRTSEADGDERLVGQQSACHIRRYGKQSAGEPRIPTSPQPQHTPSPTPLPPPVVQDNNPWDHYNDARQVRYEHCFADGGMVTYQAPPPMPGGGGPWEQNTSMYDEERRAYVPIPVGFSCPRYSDEVEFGDLDMNYYEEAFRVDLQNMDATSDKDHGGRSVTEDWDMEPIHELDETEEAVDAEQGAESEGAESEGAESEEGAESDGGAESEEEWGGLIISGKEPEVHPSEAFMTEEESSGSDWSASRRQVERDRALKRRKGKYHSDTEADEEEDLEDMFANEELRRGSGKRAQQNRAPKNLQEQTYVDTDDSWEGISEVEHGKCGRLTAVAIQEIERFGAEVQATADVLAQKWGKSRPDILYRAGLGLRLARSPNPANQY